LRYTDINFELVSFSLSPAETMKNRIPQPKSNLELLRWKTKLEVLPTVKLKSSNKIYIAERSDHIFFSGDIGGTHTEIKGRIWGYGLDLGHGLELKNITSPGPTLEATASLQGLSPAEAEGHTVKIEWINHLPTNAHHPFVEPPRELRSPGMTSRYDVGHTVVHLHGAHVPWTSDGYSIRVSKLMSKHPRHKKTVLRPGQNETFVYPNTQPGGATLWYHDHTMDVTSINVYAGLAGAYLLRHPDEHTLASLPKGEYEIPLIIQDRSFVEPDTRLEDDSDNLALLYGDAAFLTDYLAEAHLKKEQQTFRTDFFNGGANSQPSPEFKGQVICVNGKIWPFLEVEPRPYRLRIVNGSNSRMYVLRLSNELKDGNSIPETAAGSIWQIGADGGLFAIGVEFTGNISPKKDATDLSLFSSFDVNSKNLLVLSSGERADVIVDFSQLAGTSVYLTNHATEAAPLGNGGDAAVSSDNKPLLVNGILKFVVKDQTEIKQNTNSPLTLDPDRLNLDLTSIAELPKLATDPNAPQTPTRQFVIKEFGPVPLTVEEGIKDNPRGWKAITFQPEIDRPTEPGFLWAGSPPDLGALTNGGPFPDPVAPPHRLGTTIELWEFYNLSPDVHPIHLHHSSVQLHSRVPLFNPIAQTIKGKFGDALEANETGWKDTIRVNPRELTSILVRFDDRGDKHHDYTGHYVWHCHILEHEDMGMMRPLEIEH
jgi:spore coat protein A, manganese oxidase